MLRERHQCVNLRSTLEILLTVVNNEISFSEEHYQHLLNCNIMHEDFEELSITEKGLTKSVSGIPKDTALDADRVLITTLLKFN